MSGSSAERFVHENDFGVHRECAGQADALLHAAGEGGGQMVFPAAQSHQFEHLLCFFAAFFAAHAHDFEAISRVVEYGAMREEGESLEHHGHAMPSQVE